MGADTPTAWDRKCLNCGAVLTGSFCAECGQRAIPPYPTISELASDAFNEVSGWDGRFARTLRTLIRRPGELTREFMAGRRVRFISPIRVYLVASLVYFLVAASAPGEGSGTVVEAGGVRIGVFTPQPGSKTETAPRVTEEDKREALASIDSAPAFMRPVIRRAVEDPQGFQRSLYQTMPRVLFALLPVFAAIVAIFYRGRNYPEHLYFALHLHAFVFLALTISELAKLVPWTYVEMAIGISVVVWIAAYAILSLRRVYGGSTLRTIAKAAGIGGLYLVASVPAFLVMLTWAALRR
jgi:hypothetical protein